MPPRSSLQRLAWSPSAAGAVALAFAATPFLVPEIAAELDVQLGSAGLLSTFQVGGFAATTFLAGRLLRPQASMHKIGLIATGIAHLLSAVAPEFWQVLALQLLAGIGMGFLTWLSWSEATRHRRGLADVAAVAPLVAAFSSPLLSWLAGFGSYRRVRPGRSKHLAVMLIPAHYGELPAIGRNVSDSKTNRILLAALFLLMLFSRRSLCSRPRPEEDRPSVSSGRLYRLQPQCSRGGRCHTLCGQTGHRLDLVGGNGLGGARGRAGPFASDLHDRDDRLGFRVLDGGAEGLPSPG